MSDTGGLWMVTSGVCAGVKLLLEGVRVDVVERVRVARADLVVENAFREGSKT